MGRADKPKPSATDKGRSTNPFGHRTPQNRTVLYLVRHGEVIPAEKGAAFTYNGHLDVALSKEGKRQAGALADFFRDKPVDAVYASDLSRAAYSARVVARAKGLKPALDPRFRELHFGHWEGLSLPTVISRYGVESLERFKDLMGFRIEGGGENLKDLRERVIPALKEMLKNHHAQTVMLAAHGGVNRVVLFHALGLPPRRAFHLDQSFGCVNRIDFYGPPGQAPRDAVVRFVNHLPYESAHRVGLEMMETANRRKV